MHQDITIMKTLSENKQLVMVEGNSTCQVGSLIDRLTGIHFVESILK